MVHPVVSLQVQMSSMPLSRNSSPPPPRLVDQLNWQDASVRDAQLTF